MKKIFLILFFSFIFTNTAFAQLASFTINLGVSETGDNKALLYITAPADIAFMQISNKSDFNGSTKTAFTSATLWDICSGLSSCVAGNHTINIKLISKSGSEQVISNSIKYTGKSINTIASEPVLYKAFSRTLKLGSEGSDVKELQVYLNNHGFEVASSGPGSKGFESTYFGPRTANALKLFQEANAEAILTPVGLSAGSGIMGAKTSEFIRNNP